MSELHGVYMSSDGTPLPVVRKSNLLVESICRATTNEKRIIIMGASKVLKDDPVGKTYSFHLSEVRKYSGIKNKRLYEDLETAIIGVKRRELWLKQEEGKFTITNWFSWVDYDRETLTLKFRFDQSVHEFLTILGENFTTYLLSNAISLNKAHYITLFELIKSYEYKGKGGKFYREIKLDYLRETLNLKDTGYDKFYDIKRFIIEPAIKAINKNTDINIYKVDYLKTGRSYTGICFYCEPSNQIRMIINTEDDYSRKDEEDIPEDKNQNNEQKSISNDVLRNKLIECGMITPVIDQFLDKYELEHINRNIDYALEQQKNGKVKNISRYLYDSIENDYANKWDKERREIQAKAEAEKEAKAASRKAKQKNEQAEKLQKQAEIERNNLIIAEFEALSDEQKNVKILKMLEERKGLRKFLNDPYQSHGVEAYKHSPAFRGNLVSFLLEN
ncbi:MAG: RepB family plasmid replication initiator protein [Bacteroidia bacterium]|nr:MAG: RepB family plasmid replication initiator protein [Bacteroidia bacterium]